MLLFDVLVECYYYHCMVQVIGKNRSQQLFVWHRLLLGLKEEPSIYQRKKTWWWSNRRLIFSSSLDRSIYTFIRIDYFVELLLRLQQQVLISKNSKLEKKKFFVLFIIDTMIFILFSWQKCAVKVIIVDIALDWYLYSFIIDIECMCLVSHRIKQYIGKKTKWDIK